MNLDDLLQQRRILMQHDEESIHFVDAERPHFKLLVQFPTTRFVQPVDGYFKFTFNQPSFHKHFSQFQSNIKRFVLDEFQLEYEYESGLEFRFDPEACAYFHHKGVDREWTPDDRYVIPIVAIHGLKKQEGQLRLDMQAVQLQFYENVPILPDLTIPLFKMKNVEIG